ncbi:uncharacterized protein [Lepeophtheirus salmonis]|uniref:uncharacterized protein isoform X2 n=1 Tax=Lepeophtheirus salmonis TaxID=72036 RepID=UPI001AE9A2C0|nr:uncharacterized threonine-rich GPI-anchored glycoprotein PJ4664.02-like isoform X2 [Lepeophtheirus salmonis]
MSFLTEVSSSAGGNNNLDYTNTQTTHESSNYDYHLPHTKTIDLIGEEFAPRKDSPTITTGSTPLSGSNSSLLQAISASGGQVVTLPNVSSLNHHDIINSTSVSTSSVSAENSTVISTLPFNAGTHISDVMQQTSITPTTSSNSNTEENGVLLCNLDELSRYIPETFYSDFNITEPKLDYLESKQNMSSLTSVSALGSSSIMVSSGSPILSTTAASTSLQSPFHQSGTPITIQLPTQPQPQQGIKTLTYVQNSKNSTVNTTSLQPVKLTTGFAYTATGEKISIQGLTDTNKNSTVQVQVKPQTLQLTGLDASKLTVLQELPDVSKVVIQDPHGKSIQNSNIGNILEDIKTGSNNNHQETVADENSTTVGYTTAIPVAVSSLHGSSLKKPSATVLMPNKRSRNIIFAGNTLPQGAIPIQINGLNALPISAVKSIPLNIGTLTSTQSTIPTTNPHAVTSRKASTKLDFVKSPGASSFINTHSNKMNNNSIKCPIITSSSSSSTTINGNSMYTSSTKAIGNNKTCTWVFENGEVCGKTFSKSYNLVVHMRMHEDVRPFCCSLCDQTFRQKAHLQRHETTHGIGVKVSRNSSTLKKRKKNKTIIATSAHIVLPTGTNVNSNLQKRLSRVDDKFGLVKYNEESEGNTLERGPTNNRINAHNPQIIKSDHPSNKFSSHDIDEAIKAAVESSNLNSSSNTTNILSLKREPTTGDDELHHSTSKVPHMSVKVEPTTSDEDNSDSSKPLDNNRPNSMSNQCNTNNSNSHSPITAQFVQHPGSTTIVIDNLEDHSPEIQKEILNALLADHSTGTSLFTIQQSSNAENDPTKLENHGHQHEEDVESGNSSQSFPPVTVQEFLQENSSTHILVENSQPE